MIGQRTTRPGLKMIAAPESVAADTIWLDSAQISAIGYEKSLRSTVESVFLTNRTLTDACKVCISVEYRDMNGRQLHQRDVVVDAFLPAGQTRMVRFPSWDRQKVWYYHRSDPTRTRMQATPYDVKMRVKWAIAP